MQARISTYASTPSENLNDDQKRTLKTLPSLEAVQKELEEVKKAIEVVTTIFTVQAARLMDKTGTRVRASPRTDTEARRGRTSRKTETQ